MTAATTQTMMTHRIDVYKRQFQDIAVEFYDLIMENDHLAALLGCRGNYDIAIQIDEVTGTMTGWHWFK